MGSGRHSSVWGWQADIMGSAHSTRKITLVNDDKAGVIKLSESLAYRLRGQIEGQQAAAEASGPAAAAESPLAPGPPSPTPIDSEPVALEPIAQKPLIPESPVHESAAPEPVAPESLVTEPTAVVGVNEGTTKVASADAETSPPPDIGVASKAGPPPSLSHPSGNIPPWSIYAEEAHLMVMRLREEKEREMEKLNLDWREKMEGREKEFTKMARFSAEEVTAALKDVEKLFVKASCDPVCQNQQEAVMSCYQDHPRQSLRCAREVEHFTQCVDLSRLQSVMKQRAN